MQQRLTKEWMASLTQDDFDQIPEWDGIGREKRVFDGKTVWVPVIRSAGPQWFDEDETPGCRDPNGQWWRFIRHDGKLYKERSITQPWAS